MMCEKCGVCPATSVAVGLTDPPRVLGGVCGACHKQETDRLKRERAAAQLPAAPPKPKDKP